MIEEKFLNLLPDDFFKVLAVLKQFSFEPILVGGIPRDFLLNEKIGHDFDIELHHSTIHFNRDVWKSFGKTLTGLGKVQYLNYEIIRLNFNNLEFEFSPPRSEIFNDSKGHSNFEATFDFTMSFSEASMRRDFTVNSIGFQIHSKDKLEILDPHQGIAHLKEKLLFPIGENFSKDPVRYLRAHRFAQKLNFDFSDKLKHELEGVDISEVSASHVWAEIQKAKDPFSLLKSINLSFLKFDSHFKPFVKNPSLHESWLLGLAWAGEDLCLWESYFKLSPDTAKKIGYWVDLSKELNDLNPEVFKAEFEEVIKLEKFKTLFDWYHSTKNLIQKFPDLKLLDFINEYLVDWGYLFKFQALSDVKHIEPPLRAKYQLWNLCQRL